MLLPTFTNHFTYGFSTYDYDMLVKYLFESFYPYYYPPLLKIKENIDEAENGGTHNGHIDCLLIIKQQHI